MADCVFCSILQGKIPGQKVHETPYCAAILDINPIAPGHALVMPRDHHEIITDLPPAVAADLMKATQAVTRAVLKATGAEGCNVLMNNRRCSGQAIDHAHFHVIPRKSGDQIRFGWNPKPYGPGEIEKLGDSLRKSLES